MARIPLTEFTTIASEALATRAAQDGIEVNAVLEKQLRQLARR